MKNLFRLIAVCAIALGSAFVAQPSQAQTSYVLGSQIQVRVTPRPDIPYQRGNVPPICIPAVVNGAGVNFCAIQPGQQPTKFDATVALYFGGWHIAGFKVPDDCMLTAVQPFPGMPVNMLAEFCQNNHPKW